MSSPPRRDGRGQERGEPGRRAPRDTQRKRKQRPAQRLCASILRSRRLSWAMKRIPHRSFRRASIAAGCSASPPGARQRGSSPRAAPARRPTRRKRPRRARAVAARPRRARRVVTILTPTPAAAAAAAATALHRIGGRERGDARRQWLDHRDAARIEGQHLDGAAAEPAALRRQAGPGHGDLQRSAQALSDGASGRHD